ncbi:MAG: DUF58 domain-containing protein [Schleiferiaceae bacterium]|nr:DUF58 domain-containing protein [Schleiferiaceae bacterium]
MNTQELLKKVRRIEIKTRRLSSNLFSGEYHSSFKGRGMAFSEVRKYQAGDDIRAIDWNVSARLREPYLKVFEEERELTMMLLIDVSGSGQFGTRSQFKRELITEIAATLAFSAIQNNDKVGVILFSDQVEKFIPPAKGRTHILRLIREMLELEPQSAQTQISEALRYFSATMKKRAIAFVLSDFMDQHYHEPLRVAAQRHDLTGIRVIDRHELKLPNLGLVPLQDPESGLTRWVHTSSGALQRAQAHRLEGFKRSFETQFARSGAGYLSVETGGPYVKKLLQYFKQKAR